MNIFFPLCKSLLSMLYIEHINEKTDHTNEKLEHTNDKVDDTN